jgi:hypothetical protein
MARHLTLVQPQKVPVVLTPRRLASIGHRFRAHGDPRRAGQRQEGPQRQAVTAAVGAAWPFARTGFCTQIGNAHFTAFARAELEAEFDHIFAGKTGFVTLDRLLTRLPHNRFGSFRHHAATRHLHFPPADRRP